jgi:hypothetical protein
MSSFANTVFGIALGLIAGILLGNVRAEMPVSKTQVAGQIMEARQ